MVSDLEFPGDLIKHAIYVNAGLQYLSEKASFVNS